MASKKTSTSKPSKRVGLTLLETKKAASVPLIIEPHPRDYSGFPFITLIQYRKQPMLAIVDNASEEIIRAYVLDLCGPEHVDEEAMINTALEWYSESRNLYPISVEFSRRGMTPMTSKVYRSLNMEFVARVIGPVPVYPTGTVKSIKRRRRKPIPPGAEVMSNVVSAEEFFQ